MANSADPDQIAPCPIWAVTVCYSSIHLAIKDMLTKIEDFWIAILQFFVWHFTLCKSEYFIFKT